MEFMRGMYNNISRLPDLFSNLSICERERIRQFTFKELWGDLWMEQECKKSIDFYNKASLKYKSIQMNIPKLLDTTTSLLQEPPWGFPKGKKNHYNESSVVCALREFSEETHLSTESVILLDISPKIEKFQGTDNKYYETKYYIAMIDKPRIPRRLPTPGCIRRDTISEEASDVGWFSLFEASKKLGDRHTQLLTEVHNEIYKNL